MVTTTLRLHRTKLLYLLAREVQFNTRRIIVTGSRQWDDAQLVTELIDTVAGTDPESPFTLVHGHCRKGVDEIADLHCQGLTQWAIQRYPADWHRDGQVAGMLRNMDMVRAGGDLCLAFIGPCVKPQCNRKEPHGTHGATHCADTARMGRIPTLRVKVGWR